MWLYSLALGTGLVAASPWWVMRMLMTSRYREGLGERLGRVPDRVRGAVAGRSVVWVHAVSVGEVLAASRLVGELEAALVAQDGKAVWRVVVSTTTRTGQVLARERFGAERVFWFPLDFAWAVRAWMRVLRPRMVVLVESELWPRLLAECRREGVPVVVVNARMSDRSFRRAMRVRRLWGRVLRGVTLFLAESEDTAKRLRQLGVGDAAVRVTGNLKYDIEPRSSAMVEVLRPLLHRGYSLVAGSLLGREDVLLLEAWKGVLRRVPRAVLVMAPRHPERFAEVARLIRAAGFPVYRGSELVERAREAAGLQRLEPRAVVLLDTVGDLAAVYAVGDVAFVGGSLVREGGHNPLEPARFGVPVVMGSSFENFRGIVGAMTAVHGIAIAHDGRELEMTLAGLLMDHVAADALGQRGRQVFERESGATGRCVGALHGFIRSHGSAHTGVRA